MVGLFVSLAAMLWVLLPASTSATSPGKGLAGMVRASDGKPMEGVTISARAQGSSIATSVYTNRAGEYYFPPLGAGQYRVWAQAVGYEMARSELTISPGKKIQQNFTLKHLQDFEKQLSAVEWADSLPSDTPQDRRMNMALNQMCTTCHISGYLLSKRFDSAGWGMLIDFMIETQTGPASSTRKLFQGYKDELVEYLARVRGPKPSPMKLKPLPRVTGEATEIVVTEYDVPRGDKPDYVITHNGSDWSEGIPSRYENNVLHDAVVARDGNIYFSDNTTPERTLGKLDPKTGRVTNYKLADKDGFAVATHGAAVDPNGNIWLTNNTEGSILKFDPEAEQFQRYPLPGSITARATISVAVDSKGVAWATQANGVMRLKPATGEYTEFKAVTPGGFPYGITVDAEDNAWFAQLAADRVGYVNGQTGEVGEVILPPRDDIQITDRDREISKLTGTVNNLPVIYQKGPRRMGADRNGDTVWIGEFYAGRLLKIDIHTKKLTEYPLPNPNSHPYSAAVDKNHMVWINLQNSDRIAKFNPFTEQFTEYPLPSLATDLRFIDVDNSTDVPTVWLPYFRVNKIAKMEFRAGSARQSPPSGK
jgi:streptogramin lyase